MFCMESSNCVTAFLSTPKLGVQQNSIQNEITKAKENKIK